MEGHLNSYFEAAGRKVAIAEYHAARLSENLTSDIGGTESLPSIPVQAHFEGVIVAVMAAVDQVAQGVNSALRLNLSAQDLVEEAFKKICQVPGINEWLQNPLGRDLRRLRVRMLHYSYEKMPEGPRWLVEPAVKEYKGSRELLSYVKAAVEYAQQLRDMLPKIKQVAGT